MANGAETIAVLLIIVGLVFLSLAIYAARFKRVPPNHALVIYGRRYRSKGKEFLVITGGGKFITPVVETFELLSLEPFQIHEVLDGVIENVYDPTPRVLRVQVLATAQLSDEVEEVLAAAQNFLHHSKEELKQIVARTLEGHTRGFLAGNGRAHDRVISDLVRDAAQADLGQVGIRLVSVSLSRLGPSNSADALVGTVDALQRRVESLEAHLGRLEERIPRPLGRRSS